MSELLPPNPDVSGWHFVQFEDCPEFPMIWRSGKWHEANKIEPAHPDFLTGLRHLTPIPSADQLAAMREIVTFFAASLAAHEAAEGPVIDDQPIWTGYEFSITAGMIRRAAGGRVMRSQRCADFCAQRQAHCLMWFQLPPHECLTEGLPCAEPPCPLVEIKHAAGEPLDALERSMRG